MEKEELHRALRLPWVRQGDGCPAERAGAPDPQPLGDAGLVKQVLARRQDAAGLAGLVWRHADHARLPVAVAAWQLLVRHVRDALQQLFDYGRRRHRRRRRRTPLASAAESPDLIGHLVDRVEEQHDDYQCRHEQIDGEDAPYDPLVDISDVHGARAAGRGICRGSSIV